MSGLKERRHRFRSFKDRTDSMKIELGRNLSTRAHDYVETSHFLATLEHWKEVNISGDFTDFSREVEPLCQTLAQILHHQERIFASLHTHISKHDVNSIQPLLELMSQFIHDLGPDFMAFYKPFLHLIIDLSQQTNPNDAQNMRNTSNVLEWCFNTLAFSFKYLSRVLTEDLTPTFEELLPVLEMTKKTYVSRFCAEALSFLVKKLRPEPLLKIVRFSFNDQQKLLENNRFYRESLVTLYSEAMKNTQDTFHSKALVVFSVLLENAFTEHASSDVCVGTLCDIMLQVSKHGSAQACERFCEMCLTYLESVVLATESETVFQYVLQVLITMSFSESGKKLLDWTLLFTVVELLLQKAEGLARSLSRVSLLLLSLTSQLFSIIMRNCPNEHLLKHVDFMLLFLASIGNNKHFLSFYALATAIAPEKMATFGALKTLQHVINRTASKEELIYLAQKSQERPPEALAGIVLPPFLITQLLEMMETDIKKPFCGALLQGLFWKLKLLAYAPDSVSDSPTPFRVFQSLADRSLPQTPFLHDVLGAGLSVAVRLLSVSFSESAEMYTLIQNCLETCHGSFDFLMGATQYLEKHLLGVMEQLASDSEHICFVLAQNFSLPDKQIRIQTSEFLCKLHESLGENVPFIVSQIRLIDQVPLTVANSNDIKMRIRHVTSEFSLQKSPSDNEKLQLSYYVIGLLSNSFQPCWIAVYDALPQLATAGCADNLWETLMAFVKLDYMHQFSTYRDDEEDEVFVSEDMDVCQSSFDVLDEKLRENIRLAASSILYSEGEALSSILNGAKAKKTATAYNPQVRERVIKALQAVPGVVELHGAEFVQYVVRLLRSSRDSSSVSSSTQDSPEDDSLADSSWTDKDRHALVAVCGKFKKMRQVPGNGTLFELVLENLSLKQPGVQQESLNVLFAWNNERINKYRDNLRNLLDDKLFRDELQILVNKNRDSKIEQGDESEVIPIVLRILYGRAKGASNNKSKNGRKFAIATILPSLPDAYVEKFLAILAHQIDYESFFENSDAIRVLELELPLRKKLSGMVGYLNMLPEVYNGLGYKFAHILKGTIQPLTFTLLSSQKVLDSVSEENDEEVDKTKAQENDDLAISVKIARTVRQLGFKCLDQLFKITASVYDWNNTDAELVFGSIVKPRLSRFAQENAQQPSALMGLVLGWINAPQLVPFLYLDEYACVHAIMDLLASMHAKDPVKVAILDFSIAAFTRKDIADDRHFTLLALVVDGLLRFLPRVIGATTEKTITTRAATLLLLIIDGSYVQDHETQKALVDACASAIRKPSAQIAPHDRVSILLSLVSILEAFECSFDDLDPLFDVCSLAFRSHKDRNVREALVQIFAVIGGKFTEFAVVADLLAGLNAFSATRITEPDFYRRLKAFKTITEELYTILTPKQWLPIVQACLFFINDPDEIVIRSNASYTLVRFVEGFADKSAEDVKGYRALFYAVVVPQLRIGLKKESGDIKDGYVHILATVVKSSHHFPEFASMKVLLSADPDEDFFKNFTHIQLKCRGLAIRSLSDHKDNFSAESVHHYLFPMTESYTVCVDEKTRNMVDTAHDTWALLLLRMRWDHFRGLFRNKIRAVSQSEDAQRRDRIHLAIHLSRGMADAFAALRAGNNGATFSGIPEDPDRVEEIIMREFFGPIMEVVHIRHDETVEDRTLLVEAAVNCLLCVSELTAEAAISGTLTSTCQALRSRYQPTRDTVRKTLCRVTKIVGAKYLKFLVQELKSALSRGAQIHILSYTLHAILASVRGDLESGDLDDSAPRIVDILMEDIFGAAGQDKDAEDYVSSMREVKLKKSFETGEILCSNISLTCFRYVIEPIKMLLKANIPLKTRHKLDELFRKYSQGLMSNSSAATNDVLVLCYEIHQQSTATDPNAGKHAAVSEKEDYFLVKTNTRTCHFNVDKSQAVHALQRFCFELMRSALAKHSHLMTVANLDGFLPLMATSLEAEDESLLIALFRVMNLVVGLDFDASRDSIFTDSASKLFSVIQNLASTTSELSQTCLRYLATVVREKLAVKLSDAAITYVLVKIMPDLEEPDQQALAFNFLRAVLAQHILLPEVYEMMEKVSSIMVVNHNKGIRDMSRNIYFQFLMEYEQGPAKLEKSFKFLVNNLGYPTQAGRESIMELMHSIVSKGSELLLSQLATSFFVGLANVAAADDILKCREMASALIAQIMEKTGDCNLAEIQQFILSWMLQKSNPLLRRCGLLMYRIHLSVFGYGSSEILDAIAFKLVENLTRLSTKRESESESETHWEDAYTAMGVFSSMCTALGSGILAEKFEAVWRHVFEMLLYPHTWVRLLAARLVGVLVGNVDKLQFSVSGEVLQEVAYMLLMQLRAPVVSAELGTQVVKNMIQILTKWQKEETPYYEIAPERMAKMQSGGKNREKEEDIKEKGEHMEEKDGDEEEKKGPRFALAVDFVLSRVCSLMRQDVTRSDKHLTAKKLAIQLGAVIVRLVAHDKASEVARDLLFAMYHILQLDAYTDAENEVLTMARESTKAIEDKLGLAAYLEVHTAVRQKVDQKRTERKVKWAQLVLTDPEAVARRKIQKHENFRKRRKHRKDDKGHYRAKRTKKNQV